METSDPIPPRPSDVDPAASGAGTCRDHGSELQRHLLDRRGNAGGSGRQEPEIGPDSGPDSVLCSVNVSVSVDV